MHECPECWQACYCGGDIDDCEVDSSAADRCTHCPPIVYEDDDGDSLDDEDDDA